MKRFLCLSLAALTMFSALLCGCSDESSEQNSTAETQAVESTDTTVKTTGEKIHINDSTLGEIWITELEGVPVNTLNNDNFTADVNFKYYNENGKAASLEGIDISSYSGDVDWEKVKASGIDFAII